MTSLDFTHAHARVRIIICAWDRDIAARSNNVCGGSRDKLAANEPRPLNENGGGVRNCKPVFMEELTTLEEFLSQTKEEGLV